MRDRLIIFSRYPEPGKTKTRMIPVLGEVGAANLQRQMTEHTLKQVRKLQRDRSFSLQIYFTGGNQSLMQDWLGTDAALSYQQQSQGDLGQRMFSAFAQSFSEGSERVVIIGTDCPEIDAEILAQAFDLLSDRDLVLGPAKDGGYYLIGLRYLFAQLFTGIPWGTSEVFLKTQSVAQQLGLRIATLAVLADIDRPEDLERFPLFNF